MSISFPAHAHSVDLFAYAAGSDIRGNVLYGDGTPVANAAVEISWNTSGDDHEHDPKEAVVHTDADGAFVFSPPVDAEYLFICRTADGHRAARSVVFGGKGNETADESVQQQLNALQEQLHAYERRTRFRDVLGGLGYILGLAGVVALIKTRRRAS